MKTSLFRELSQDIFNCPIASSDRTFLAVNHRDMVKITIILSFVRRMKKTAAGKYSKKCLL